MARKREDIAAAKAKKQKIFLIVGAVLLLGVAAIQVPKLMGGGSGTEAAAVAATGNENLVVTSTTSGGVIVPASTTVAAANTGAVVAGVALPRNATLVVAPSQLASFTLFEVKDPFAPQADDGPTAEQAAADSFYDESGAAPAADVSSGDGSGGTTAPATQTTPAASAPPIVYATINLDGKPQQVKVKEPFPAKEPLFVLRSLKKKQAKIGVAGGSFDNGQAVTVVYGKKLTLANTATGVRYVLKLVYTGAAPEVIEGFTTGASTSATAGAGAETSTAATTAAK